MRTSCDDGGGDELVERYFEDERKVDERGKRGGEFRGALQAADGGTRYSRQSGELGLGQLTTSTGLSVAPNM